ncbi:MAG: SDR family NAD(P)-dependent oxidoreductase [Smithella sp.]
MTVGITDVNAAGLEELKKCAGGKIGYLATVDVTDADKVASVLKDFNSAAEGRMDVLFNNAGILRVGPFEDIPLKDHHAILNINMGGMINCAYFAFPYLKNTVGSRVINMASVASIYRNPDGGDILRVEVRSERIYGGVKYRMETIRNTCLRYYALLC